MNIGYAKPNGQASTRVYVGQLEHLQGEHALVSDNPPYGVVAQFDKITTGLAFGWWAFRGGEFASVEDYEATVKRLEERSGYSRKVAICKACEKLCTLTKKEAPTPRYI